METPVIKKRRGISPIWILPFIALLIGGWLLFDNYQNAGIDIIVHFADAEGITVGKTNVIYKGIVIGTVRDIQVDPGVDSVSLRIEINKVAKQGVVKDSKFWIVKPEVSAGQISGLETLLSGSYIAVQSGASEQPCREFIGLPEPPPISQEAPGLHLKLTSKNLGSIQRNTKLYYKNIPVGSVQGYTLDEAGSGVIIDAYIESRYKHLIKTKTRFWNSSGINFKGGLSGFKFRMESMAALIYGGISLYTPTYQENSPAAESNRIFSLYEDFDDAEFGLKMTLKLPTAQGIEAGITKIVYRGFEAGVVTDIDFDDDKHVVTALINIDPRAEFILREGTRFWVVEPEFSINRVRNLDTLIKGVYIAFEPGDGIFKDYFEVQKAPLTDKLMPAGKRFTIISKDSGSIAIAAPVLYRKLKVGEIFDFHLGADGSNIRGQILIYQKYTHLIKNNSVFWKVGGINIKADFNGIDVETGTLNTMLAGGISFTNPDDGKQPKIAAEHRKFTLYDNIEEASQQVPALRKQGVKIQLKATNAKDFSVGSPVLYKFVEVGAVTGFALAEEGKHVLIDLFIAQKYAPLLNKSSLFYNISNISVKGDLSGIEIKTGSVRSMLAGGIAFISPDSDNQDSDRIRDGQQYTLYDSKDKALDFGKSMISIKFANSKGLKSGLKIRYHNVDIGTIEAVGLNPGEMDVVICQALIKKTAVKLFTAGTKIWLVEPEISIRGINNLDTIISGSYITLDPGNGSPETHFTALKQPPAVDMSDTGLKIILESSRVGSLKKGSPIYYRQIRIGNVIGTLLAPTAQQVWIHINIEPPYDRLVYGNTKFWNSSGIRVKAGLFSGVKIDTESVEAIVAGGISMATPEAEEMGMKALPGEHFSLHDNAKECWLKWQPSIILK